LNLEVRSVGFWPQPRGVYLNHMLYRPRYCCNCGEPIEREEWRLWNSRRFCQLCETEFKGIDLIPRAIVSAGLLLAMLAGWSYIRSSGNYPASGQRNISGSVKRNLQPDRSAAQESPRTPVSKVESVTPPKEVPPQSERQDERAVVFDGESPRTAPKAKEATYYCGMPTKKGTPCSRRVKKKGPCWQHADSTGKTEE
jgi:hypothetical protein